jgi:hypothetical protein
MLHEKEEPMKITRLAFAATMLSTPAMAQTPSQFPKHAEMVCIPVWGKSLNGGYRMAVEDGGIVGATIIQTNDDGNVMHNTVAGQVAARNGTLNAIEIHDHFTNFTLKRFLAFDFSRDGPELSGVSYETDKGEIAQVAKCTVDWTKTTGEPMTQDGDPQ